MNPTTLERPRTIDVLVPAYNEAACLPALCAQLQAVLEPLKYDYRIVIVDDGSTDATRETLKTLRAECSRIGFIRLSRNFGHQAALSAGLDRCDGDAVIMLDADLQHPPRVIPRLLEAWEGGADVVSAVRRTDAAKLPFLKRWTSRLFYWLLNRISDVPITANAPDFRLASREVVLAVRRLREQARFLRGLFRWVGFRHVTVEYEQEPRTTGVTKYSTLRMFRFAAAGVVAFTRFPLRVATLLGVFVSLLSFGYGLYAAYQRLVLNQAVPGWASLAVLVSFLAGAQLLTLGVLGEYLGQVLEEAKRRPLYLVAEQALPVAERPVEDSERRLEMTS